MRVEDLQHDELLELDGDGGAIRFAGQRALLLDAVAMGVLRQSLVANFGVTAARAVLTQFGFAHGWRAADAMRAEFDWASEEELRRAGPQIHALAGHYRIQPGSADLLSASGTTILASYEAEQHLLHLGLADSPVCWTICGLLSGYMSRVTSRQIFVLEDRCVGQAHSACRILGRTREEWAGEREGELEFFDPGRVQACLDVSLSAVAKTLRAAEQKLSAHRRALVRIVPDVQEPDGIVARSTSMKAVVAMARRVSKVDVTVLITGESGVGKERISRLVHDESPRASGPFIAINCGAITETLLESELFGHKRGAFTGATSDRPGLFEAAEHGTLLLDEIGDISHPMQVKLLRVLQEREIRRVGCNQTRKVDVRVLAATNRDLSECVKQRSFREDLYYRLKVVDLVVPPLRERHEDILPLARVLLATSALRMERKVTGLSPKVADRLLQHRWPGNVRELANAMERAVALASSDRVEFEQLPEEIRREARVAILTRGEIQPLSEVEKAYLLAALKLNDGNQARTAKALQIGTATLYRKLKQYGVLRKSPPPAEASTGGS